MPDIPRRKRGEGRRRLIAGLRVTRQDEALLEVVRPLFPEADTEGELAYRLWRRGLEVSLAEAASLSSELPTALAERNLASLVAQRLLLCLPLLRRTGALGILDLLQPLAQPEAYPSGTTPTAAADPETIADSATDAIISLGGGDFL
jgi:hypothetical protein